MKSFDIYFILILTMVSLCQCSHDQRPKLSDAQIHAIDDWLNSYTESGFSGCVLISDRNNILLNKGYGLANREDSIPNQISTLFEVASITKLFTCVAVLQLAEQGRLNLNDDLGVYLGRFGAPKDQATINHLILHTAGLVPRGHELDYSSRSDFVESVKSTPPESIPGEKYRYTNAGYTMLAAIIEIVSEMPYENYLKEHIFNPIALSKTLYWDYETDNNLAIGYQGNHQDSLIPYKASIPEWGDKGPTGIITSVGDLYKFLMALQSGKLLRDESLQKMFNEQMNGEAYGFHVIQKPKIGKVLARGGGLPHFESQISWYVDQDIKLILTINNRLRLRQPVWDKIESIMFDLEGEKEQ